MLTLGGNITNNLGSGFFFPLTSVGSIENQKNSVNRQLKFFSFLAGQTEYFVFLVVIYGYFFFLSFGVFMWGVIGGGKIKNWLAVFFPRERQFVKDGIELVDRRLAGTSSIV